MVSLLPDVVPKDGKSWGLFPSTPRTDKEKGGGEIPFKLQGGKNGMCVIFILRSCPKSLASGNKFLWAGAPSQLAND